MKIFHGMRSHEDLFCKFRSWEEQTPYSYGTVVAGFLLFYKSPDYMHEKKHIKLCALVKMKRIYAYKTLRVPYNIHLYTENFLLYMYIALVLMKIKTRALIFWRKNMLLFFIFTVFFLNNLILTNVSIIQNFLYDWELTL